MRFRDVSIKSKLRGINVVTGAIGLLLSCSAFLAYDYRTARERIHDRLDSLSTVVANQSTAVVSFDDAKAAAEVLHALDGESRIVAAALYGKTGRRLATYVRRDAPGEPLPDVPGPDGGRFLPDRLEVTRPILSDGERVGTVHVRSSLHELHERLWRNAGAMLLTLLGSSLIALLLCLRMEGAILRPIFDLARTMKAVSTTQDFALRAVPHGRDETGSLVEGFNVMLAEIEKRDDALRSAQATLEQRVAERTLELSTVNVVLARENAERAKAERVARESEERYRQLIDLSPDAILIQADGRVVLANAAALRLLRAEAPAELLGRPILDLIVPEQRPAAAENLRLLQENGRPQPPREQRYARLDGSPVDVEVACSAILFDGRRASIAVVRDISQRKEVERLKNEFISTVSHELRTPLTSIRGSLGLLESGKLGQLPPKAAPMVQIANSNCQRLVRLINDILDVEKIEAGKMDFSLRPVEIGSLVQTAIESARGLADSLGVRLVLEAPLRGARASADPDRLLQVMANLLSNAAKFSPSPSTVEVGVARRDGRLRVYVRDHGTGIPEAFRSRIFQKFAQADGSDTRQKGGTGLGLSICKAILEHMGGSIGFETKIGAGTTFYVELPELVEVPAAGPADGPAILVVEDDHDVALLLSLMLQQGGYRPEIARDAAEARELLKQREYAALTLDIMLPDESGISFLQELRRGEPTRQLPVVIVSAKAETARRELEGSAVAVVDWIEKPIEPRRLMTAVSSAMRRPCAGKPRILHVEDDAGIRELLRADVAGFAETAGAASLQEARQLLLAQSFDLVILDVFLPDGSGLDLLPHCKDAERRPIPVLVFSAFDLAQKTDLAEQIERVLVKSRVSNDELREAIQSLLQAAPAVASVREPQAVVRA